MHRLQLLVSKCFTLSNDIPALYINLVTCYSWLSECFLSVISVYIGAERHLLILALVEGYPLSSKSGNIQSEWRFVCLPLLALCSGKGSILKKYLFVWQIHLLYTMIGANLFSFCPNIRLKYVLFAHRLSKKLLLPTYAILLCPTMF